MASVQGAPLQSYWYFKGQLLYQYLYGPMIEIQSLVHSRIDVQYNSPNQYQFNQIFSINTTNFLDNGTYTFVVNFNTQPVTTVTKSFQLYIQGIFYLKLHIKFYKSANASDESEQLLQYYLDI